MPVEGSMYYKFLTADKTSEFSGFDFTPYLPTRDQPGEWLPAVTGDLKACGNGYHALPAEHLLSWLNTKLFEVEFQGELLTDDNKVIGRQMRFVKRIQSWNIRAIQEFAFWCARNTPLHDGRTVWDLLNDASKELVCVAERFARGEATEAQLTAAWRANEKGIKRSLVAWVGDSPAKETARNTVRYVARAAKNAAEGFTEIAAGDAASAAAWYANEKATRNAMAAGDTAWHTAQAAQLKRLLEVLDLPGI